MGQCSRADAERRRVFDEYVRARQRLTLDHLAEFERVEMKRTQSERQLLIDSYVLLHRSHVLAGKGGRDSPGGN